MNIRPFQIVLLAIFVAMAIGGLMLLSTFSAEEVDPETLPLEQGVTIWGTVDEQVMRNMIDEQSGLDGTYKNVSYRELDSRTFEAQFVDAAAEGRSPDLLVISNEDVVSLRSKLIPLQERVYPVRSYRSNFIDGAEIFYLSDGLYALPFAVDLLVMYWNRDMFAENGLATPPETWQDLTNRVAPRLIERRDNREITQAAVAFGEGRNVRHVGPVLLSLALQSGSQMITEDNGEYVLQLDETTRANAQPPFTSSATFYSNFSNINSPLYSWNRAQREDRSAFAAEDLAIYFGMGSELPRLRQINPNLNFDVAPIPQGEGASARRTYGKFYGFAIPQTSSNSTGALIVARALSGVENATALAEDLNLAPVTRSAVAAGARDPFRSIIVDEALVARGWLNPDPSGVQDALTQLFDDINAGRSSVSNAVGDFLSRLKVLF